MGKNCKDCKKVCIRIKDGCGNCQKVKAKIPQEKSVGANKTVSANQAVTTTTSTLLQLSNGNFSFDNLNYNSCCNPCYGYNYNNSNTNVFCLSCEGLYSISALVVLDTAPTGTESVTLALDVNSQQVFSVPLVGSGVTMSATTGLNLCKYDKVQFRIYGSAGYVGNVTGGMVSVIKVAPYIGCH